MFYLCLQNIPCYFGFPNIPSISLFKFKKTETETNEVKNDAMFRAVGCLGEVAYKV